MKKTFITNAIIIAVIVFVFTCVIKPVIVMGESMEPTLQNHDYLLVSRQAKPKHGQIVVFHPSKESKELYIKRVVATPGETVAIAGGNVFVNGKKQDQSFTKDGFTSDGISAQAGAKSGEITVPKGEIFVLGDNRQDSEDSRFIGCIKTNAVIGTAFVRMFPVGKAKVLK